MLPAAFAIVGNGPGRVLLVRRADDGYWMLPGGRIEVGESATATVVREVVEGAGVTINVTGLAGVYSDPGHVLAYPHEHRTYQQIAVCFHALSPSRDARSDQDGTIAAAWFDPEQTTQLAIHPAVHQHLANALESRQVHFTSHPQAQRALVRNCRTAENAAPQNAPQPRASWFVNP